MLTIAQVERETGLSKDVLRVWERRYGFPVPGRDAAGGRLYDAAQVQRLRIIKRLLDQGYRPGRLFAMTPAELAALADAAPAAPPAAEASSELGAVLGHILADDTAGLRQSLSRLLARQGLQRFVQDTVPALNELVGNGWASGRLAVHQEHLYAEEMGRLLRAAIAGLPAGNRSPRVLLTTLPGEEHGLGLLMVEGVLAPEGVACISLGLQTPVGEIVRAVRAYAVDVLVLSFSSAFPARLGLAELQRTRAALPGEVEVWAGGAMTRALQRHPLAGVRWTPELADCLVCLGDWRKRHSS